MSSSERIIGFRYSKQENVLIFEVCNIILLVHFHPWRWRYSLSRNVGDWLLRDATSYPVRSGCLQCADFGNYYCGHSRICQKAYPCFKTFPICSIYRFSPRTEFAHSQGALARCRHKIGLYAGLILPFTSVTTFTTDSEMWWNLFVLITSSSSGSQLFIHFADGRCQTRSFSRKALIDYSVYAVFVYCYNTCFKLNNCSFSNNLVIQAWQWVGGWVSDVKRCLTKLIESGRPVYVDMWLCLPWPEQRYKPGLGNTLHTTWYLHNSRLKVNSRLPPQGWLVICSLKNVFQHFLFCKARYLFL